MALLTQKVRHGESENLLGRKKDAGRSEKE